MLSSINLKRNTNKTRTSQKLSCNTNLQSNGITFDCKLVWRRAIAARKFLKNQGFPVFQKLWRFSVQCQLNATWYKVAYRKALSINLKNRTQPVFQVY
jgi:hypothetical protein